VTAMYGPQEATWDDVDVARVDVMGAGFLHGEHSFEAADAELDLAYTEASFQRALAQGTAVLPDTPSLYDEAEAEQQGREAGQ
jgi:hypothetical protein